METKILLLGATGATGRLLLQQLLEKEYQVRVVVRSAHRLPSNITGHKKLEVVEGTILDMTSDEKESLLSGCTAIASCLGHNLTWKGVYGKPRKLVRDSVKSAVESRQQPVRVVLMNTTGNQNRDIKEVVPFSQKLVVSLLRVLLPPHADNEAAADYLRIFGQKNKEVEWTCVRPDGLIDEPEVSGYDIYPSPIRNVIFNAGKTSRINVANFMTRLLTEPSLWDEWKGRMPVIYNQNI